MIFPSIEEYAPSNLPIHIVNNGHPRAYFHGRHEVFLEEKTLSVVFYIFTVRFSNQNMTSI